MITGGYTTDDGYICSGKGNTVICISCRTTAHQFSEENMDKLVFSNEKFDRRKRKLR